MGFEVEVYTDASAFEAAVRGLLEGREAENALLLGLLGARVPSKFMACATSDGLPVLVAYDGGFNLIVSRGPQAAITAMVEKLQELGIDLPGVCGPVPDAEHFAKGWAAARACDLALEIDQRIYELTRSAGRRASPAGCGLSLWRSSNWPRRGARPSTGRLCRPASGVPSSAREK